MARHLIHFVGSSGDRAPVKACDPVKPSQKEMDET